MHGKYRVQVHYHGSRHRYHGILPCASSRRHGIYVMSSQDSFFVDLTGHVRKKNMKQNKTSYKSETNTLSSKPFSVLFICGTFTFNL